MKDRNMHRSNRYYLSDRFLSLHSGFDHDAGTRPFTLNGVNAVLFLALFFTTRIVFDNGFSERVEFVVAASIFFAGSRSRLTSSSIVSRCSTLLFSIVFGSAVGRVLPVGLR